MEKVNKKTPPSIDEWLKEAKESRNFAENGMYLIHNGVVRKTPRAKVREGIDDGTEVSWIEFSYDEKKVNSWIDETLKQDGIFYVKVWLNEGNLNVGDDIMFVLIGGDIRPRVIDALQFLVGKIKTECVTEIEH